MYQSIQLTRLCEMAEFSDPVQMERLVVETAKTNSIPVIIIIIIIIIVITDQ